MGSGHLREICDWVGAGEKLVRAAASKAPTIVLLQIPGAVMLSDMTCQRYQWMKLENRWCRHVLSAVEELFFE